MMSCLTCSLGGQRLHLTRRAPSSCLTTGDLTRMEDFPSASDSPTHVTKLLLSSHRTLQSSPLTRSRQDSKSNLLLSCRTRTPPTTRRKPTISISDERAKPRAPIHACPAPASKLRNPITSDRGVRPTISERTRSLKDIAPGGLEALVFVQGLQAPGHREVLTCQILLSTPQAIAPALCWDIRRCKSA